MDVLSVLEEYEVEGELKQNEFLTLCPFHNDENPSCSINIEKEVFKCFSCDAKGDLLSFLAAITNVSKAAIRKHLDSGDKSPATISVSLIANWNKKLLNNRTWCNKLKAKGINKPTIEKYILGFDGTRLTIPIFNKSGEPINVRKYLPNSVKRKFINMKGYGGVSLYPIDSLDNDIVFVVEGEIKALLLNQMGFPSVASTGGAKTWFHEWSSLFKDKKIYLLFDIDKAGKRGAQRAAQSLYCVTKEIYVIDLPLNINEFSKGDITDYVVSLKHTKSDINILVKAAYKWEPMIYRETFDDTEFKVHLSECTNAQYYNRIIKSEVVVSAKDTAPFIVPYHIKVDCQKDQEVCSFCAVTKQNEFKIDQKNPVILELINVSKNKLYLVIKKAIGAPKNCDSCNFKILESMNIEEIRLIPQIQIAHGSAQNVIRQGFYVGHGIETNANYEIRARVCPQPATQYATLVIFDAEPVVDNLTTFELRKDLQIFQPEEWTKESIDKKLEEIYKDFEANITRIYKRPDLHLFYDLCYHSVLYIPFQKQIVKGWVEGLVIGDSGQGKSETILRLQEHYKLGERVDVKSSTVAGLIGGLQETAKRWFITWGIIPLNDRRLVVLEEIKGIPQEIIAKLTETRSSGIAEISKVEKARTNCRVRLIWISNPRTDRQILSYNYGVEAIKELIGNLEDIRRFDFAIVLTVNDVNKKWINMSFKTRPKIEHRFKSELCQQLILWGWSRTPVQIQFTEEANEEILRMASVMGEKYTSQIPLVESADQRLKIARLSAALAVRTYSHKDKKTLLVRKCHVEYLTEFLDKIYSSVACGYSDYSSLIKRETSIKEYDDVKENLRNLPFAKSVIETFLDSQEFSIFDIVDWTEFEPDNAKRLIGMLVRNNAIKRYKRGYIKNSSFIALLKELQLEDLENETRYSKSLTEDF